MKKRVAVLGFCFLILLALYPLNLRAATPISAKLEPALRFVEKKTLDGLTVNKVDVALPTDPVTIAQDKVIGAQQAVVPGSDVIVYFGGIEIGRGKAASDGSFSIPILPLNGGAISIIYAPSIPNGKDLLVNVGEIVQGYEKGTVTASYSYGSMVPPNAFDSLYYDMWNGAGGVQWILRDLGREMEISEVRLWFAGYYAQNRWARLSTSLDGVTFTVLGEKTVYAPQGVDPRNPTMVFPLPSGTKARWVKVEAASSSDWTALTDVAILGKVPLSDVIVAPEWTRTTSPVLSGPSSIAVDLAKPGNWLDAGAKWQGIAGSSARLRNKFWVPNSTNVIVGALIDDSGLIWLDGIPLISATYSNAAGGNNAYFAQVYLPAGEHILSVEVSNPSGFGGALVSVQSLDGQVFTRTGEGVWEMEAALVPAWQLPGTAGDFTRVPILPVKQVPWTMLASDPQAQWIWDETYSGGAFPIGTVRFRRPFTLSAPSNVTLSLATDNSATVWVDGVRVISWVNYATVGAVTISLPPGEHVLAIEAYNADLGAAGILASLKDNVTGSVILRTGDTGWQSSGYVP